MALNMANYIMRHSVNVSTMPKIWKKQNHVSDEVVVERDLERQAIFGAVGLPDSLPFKFTNENAKRPPKEVIGKPVSQ